MKLKKILVLLLPFLLFGCNKTVTNSSSIINDSSDDSSLEESFSSNSISSIQSSINDSSSAEFISSNSSIYNSSVGSSSSYIPSSSSSSSSSSSINSSSQNEVKDLGYKTIKEVKELCKSITDLNESKIGIDKTMKVTIKGLALRRFSLVKTTSKYGLDVSTPFKVLVGDETDAIACASPNSGDGNSLFGKVGDYAGKETSKYEITGYLSVYLGQPELYVPDKTFSYDPNMNINCDVNKFSKGEINFDEFYTNIKNVSYNCAGYGYGDIYTLKSVLCYDAKDNNVYTFTDGTNFMKVVKGNASFVADQVYDIVGYLSTEKWSPALIALSTSKSEKSVSLPSKDKAVNTTITEFKKIKCSQDDTNARMDAFIDGFKTLYKATVYASYYSVNGKYYVTVSDECYAKTHTTEISSRATAQNTYGMVDITNNNYWNLDLDQMFKFCPIADYINEEISFDIYFMAYQQEFLSKKPVWKIFAFNELLNA